MQVLYDISVLGLGYVNSKARTGVFRVVENVAEHLNKRNDCDIKFCGNLYGSLPSDCLNYLYDNKQFKNIPFSLPPLFKSKLFANKKREVLQTNNFNYSSVINRIGKNLWLESLNHFDKLYYKFNKDFYFYSKDMEKADIYHSPYFPLPPNEEVLKRKKVFLTAHDLIAILYPQFVEKKVSEFVLNIINSITDETWVLCVSEATKNDLLNYLGGKVDARRVIVTELAASKKFYPNTNQIQNIAVRKKYYIPEGPYLLSVCTLEPRKNTVAVIKAFVELCKQEHINDLNLVLVGTKGWMFDKIFEEISYSSNFYDRIIVTGFVDDEDLASLYTEAMLFIYPSIYEGFGLPPLEAMQCGVPVITSNTSSLPEVVGDAGIMIDPLNMDELINGILKVFRNSTLQLEMKKKSLERAQKFSWERCAKETVEAYGLAVSQG